MGTFWVISNITLWIAVLVETTLLFHLLATIGKQLQSDRLPSSKRTELQSGERAPSFEAQHPDGHTISLEETHGNYRVLAFITPGCSACKEALKAVDQMYLAPSHPEMLVISDSTLQRNQLYATENKIKTPILTPVANFIAKRYRVRSFPTMFILDEHSMILARGIVNNYPQLVDLLQEAEVPVLVYV